MTRALEYHYLAGQRFSEHNAEQKERETPYNAAVILLTMEREALYARIEQRIDLMMQQGLLAEVKGLLDRGYSPKLVSMQASAIRNLCRISTETARWTKQLRS